MALARCGSTHPHPRLSRCRAGRHSGHRDCASFRISADSTHVDPLRLIEAVTAGVAFLAAGMIVFNKGEVKGLTTGAGLWFAGSIGLACGLGFWQIGVLATLFAFSVLFLIHRLEHHLPLPPPDAD